MASKMMAKDAKAPLLFLRGLGLIGVAGRAKTVPSHGGELGQVLRISTQKSLAESAILLRRQHAYEEDHPSEVDLGVGRLLGGGFGVSDARIWGMSYYSGLEAKAGRGSRRIVNDDDKDDDDDDGDDVDDEVYDSEDDLDSDGDDIYDDTLPHKHIDDDDD